MLPITEKNLERFREWLLDGGRVEGTVRLYVGNLRAIEKAGGPTKRLVGSDLSPNALHTNKAALAAWADFTEDHDLARRVKRIKIPPAVRVTPKKELPKDDWKAIVVAIRDHKKTPRPVKACLLLLARRGLRAGDALRLQRHEIEQALRTGTLSHQAKGAKRLEFAAAPIREALEMLAAERGDWRRVEDLVTVSKRTGFDRRRAAAQVVARHLKVIASDAGIGDMHPHRLRRTYATHYVRALVGDPQAVVKLQHHMGWSNVQTAIKYMDAVNKGELDQKGVDLVAELLDA